MRLAAALTAGLLMASVPAPAADMMYMPLALLQGLDKTTARVTQFEAPVGKEVPFGTLSILVRTCQRTPPEETPENAAFLEIYENRAGEARMRLFSGWMFSSSPALSGLEHAVYDVTLLECKEAAAHSPPPGSPSPPPSPGTSRGKTAR